MFFLLIFRPLCFGSPSGGGSGVRWSAEPLVCATIQQFCSIAQFFFRFSIGTKSTNLPLSKAHCNSNSQILLNYINAKINFYDKVKFDSNFMIRYIILHIFCLVILSDAIIGQRKSGNELLRFFSLLSGLNFFIALLRNLLHI